MSLRLALVLVVATSGLAEARDSTWLLCQGIGDQGGKKVHVVASLLEHRAPDGQSREVAVTLVRGDRVGRGTIAGERLALKEIGSHREVWTGKANLSADMRAFALDGTIDAFWGDAAKPLHQPFTAKLACQELDDAAIGH